MSVKAPSKGWTNYNQISTLPFGNVLSSPGRLVKVQGATGIDITAIVAMLITGLEGEFPFQFLPLHEVK